MTDRLPCEDRDVIAFLRAILREDQEAVDVLWQLVDHTDLVVRSVRSCFQMIEAAVGLGADDLDEFLAGMQRQNSVSDAP